MDKNMWTPSINGSIWLLSA